MILISVKLTNFLYHECEKYNIVGGGILIVERLQRECGFNEDLCESLIQSELDEENTPSFPLMLGMRAPISCFYCLGGC